MTEKKFLTLVEEHQKWLKGLGGKRLDIEYETVSGVTLKNVDLSKSRMVGVTLNTSKFYQVTANKADWSKTSFRLATLDKCGISDTDLSFGCWMDMRINDCEITNCDIQGTDFRRTKSVRSWIDGVKPESFVG